MYLRGLEKCSDSYVEDPRPACGKAFRQSHYCVEGAAIISWGGSMAITGMRELRTIDGGCGGIPGRVGVVLWYLV